MSSSLLRTRCTSGCLLAELYVWYMDWQGGQAALPEVRSLNREEQKHNEQRQRRRLRPPSHANHLVFLSARPESYRGWSEELSLKSIFEPLVRRGDMPGPPVLLMGSLRSGPEALFDYSRGTR